MSTAPIFGRIENEGDRPDLTPIEFSVAGYDDEGDEHIFTFHARASVPYGTILDVLGGDGSGVMDNAAIMRFLKEAVVADEREDFVHTIDREDLGFDASMLGELGEWLGERYMNRPLRPRSARRAGSRSKRTTAAAKSRSRVAATS
jgi:hypothetical protein